jgi:hypothetical protein
MFDPQASLNMAYVVASGIEDKLIPKGTPAYERLSPREKEYQDRLAINARSNALVWNDAAKSFRAALDSVGEDGKPLYKTEDGTLDYEAIKADNPMVGNIFDLVDRWNAYSSARRAESAQGVYTDGLGNRVRLREAANSSDWFTIDKSKPLTPQQLVFLRMWATTDPDSIEKDVQYTGARDKREDADKDRAVQWFQARTGRMNADTAAKNAAGGSDDDGVYDTGNIIDDVSADELRTAGTNKPFMINTSSGKKPVKLVNGIAIDPETGRPIDTGKGEFKVPIKALGNAIVTEFNKYAGVATKVTETQTDGSEKVVSEAKGTGSRIEASKDGLVTIRLEGGRITGVLTTDGTYADRDQMAHITKVTASKPVKKGVSATELGQIPLNQQPKIRTRGEGVKKTKDGLPIL